MNEGDGGLSIIVRYRNVLCLDVLDSSMRYLSAWGMRWLMYRFLLIMCSLFELSRKKLNFFGRCFDSQCDVGMLQ